MSKSAIITIEGTVSKDPETKDVNGHRVVEVTVPYTPRRKNKQTGEWEDAGETQWWVGSFWNEDGDAIASTVRKGAAVIMTGQPEPRVYVKQDGTGGVALGVKFAKLSVVPRVSRQPQQQYQPAQPAPDAWATPAQPSYDDPNAPF